MSMNAGSRVCLGSKNAVATRPRVTVPARSLAPRARIAANKMIRCDWLSEHLNSGGFIGSQTNIAVCTGTAIMLFAVRNGWAPSTSQNSKLEKGLGLEDSGSDMLSGDPMGMTFVDVLAAGSFGHILAAGMLLGLHNMGK
ncbi:subunit psaK of photosystem I reaction center [Chloropicon primus]|uniref:Subunit psaK of photosystem I reaction center n=1 Tax=Chloropicon primus TaxID=1764295 RepID=A0A5B8MCN4_9CHLO|nr:subunit psaK of photosystem I reaction center [Chloropicon primus]UPQ97467.1 subunit psaK of photosystem I reaction center [Chloropicon primus]|mmetsp:Transcript_12372/g.34444  ORF Transcript_12372/g.34444 Transcript_12372/m.34444 type:complete len:140 (+) Transcript_12372:107-526(+)|eukprot:QDZ18256.1 subunit psaK of photosystem I reaction center [Chloropicon primus]